MCHADGFIDAKGEVYSRSNEKDCNWVDSEGHVATTGPDGNPI